MMARAGCSSFMMYQGVFMSDSFFSGSKISLLKNIRADYAVVVLLVERLEKLGVSPFSAYLNTLIDLVSKDVGSSTTLFEETLGWVEKEETPTYEQGVTGVFKRRFSFESIDLVEGLELIDFEGIVIDIVVALTNTPSINLSKRQVKSLQFEDVHAALKRKVPLIDIDEAYVNSVVVSQGERIVDRSRSLAEDIYAYLRDNEIPYYYGKNIGVYSVPYSSQEDDRHPQLTINDLNNLVIDMVPDFLI
jgi:hypothetical protein